MNYELTVRFPNLNSNTYNVVRRHTGIKLRLVAGEYQYVEQGDRPDRPGEDAANLKRVAADYVTELRKDLFPYGIRVEYDLTTGTP